MMSRKFKKTEIGKIPEDWEVKRMGEVGKVVTGKTPPTSNRDFFDGKYPFIRIPDMGKSVYIENPELFLSEKGAEHMKYLKLPPKSVMVSCLATIGKLGITTKESFTNQQINSVIADTEKLIPEWIYYFFSINKGYLESFGGGGSVYTNISKSKFENIEIPLPPLQEQKTIAKILSTLDEKIELLRKQNKTLEEIGQAIFKKWFVDNPEKEKWEEGKLGDYIECVSGCSYTSKGLENSENALVTLKSVGVNGFKQDGFKEYTGEYNEKHLVQDGDIVVAHTDLTQDRIILGKPAIVRDFGKYKKMIASMDLSIVRPVKLINKPFLYYLLSTREFHGHAQGYANGTTVIHLSRKAIPEFEFSIPDKEILEKFNILSEKLFGRIKINDLQIQSLAQIRDLLLPKLMSGKMRVK